MRKLIIWRALQNFSPKSEENLKKKTSVEGVTET